MGDLWPRLRQSAAHLTSGGSWAESFPKSTQHNLRWFWFDGLFASASDNLLLTYLPLFALASFSVRRLGEWPQRCCLRGLSLKDSHELHEWKVARYPPSFTQSAINTGKLGAWKVIPFAGRRLCLMSGGSW